METLRSPIGLSPGPGVTKSALRRQRRQRCQRRHSINNSIYPVAGAIGTQNRATSETNLKKPVSAQMAAGEMAQLNQKVKPKWTRRGEGVFTDSEYDDISSNSDNEDITKRDKIQHNMAGFKTSGFQVVESGEETCQASAKQLQPGAAIRVENEIACSSRMKFIIGGAEVKRSKDIAAIRKEIETEVRAESEQYIVKLKRQITELEDKVRYFESNQAKEPSGTLSNKRKTECEPGIPSKSRKVLPSFHSTTAASDSGPSNLADKPKSVQSASSQYGSETALSEASLSSNQIIEVKTEQQWDIPEGQLPEVKLPGKIPNEHRYRNIGEARVVLNDSSPNASHDVEDVEITSGQVLYPPAITYDADEQDREELAPGGNMGWKLPLNRRFLFPAQFPQSWVVVIFQGLNENACNNFIKIFVNAAQRRGMWAGPPKEFGMFENTDVEYIRKRFEEYKKLEVQYMMFVTKDKLDPVHHTMKLMELKFGIVTQNIPIESMNKAFGKRYGSAVIDSIVMKCNLKLGGINHGLWTSNAMVNANCFTHDVVRQEWFRPSRMFIGLDMNHASQQMGEKSIEPTIVSMAYTVGHPLKMHGTYWAQQPLERSIQPTQLVIKLVSALQTYHSEVYRFPRHIIVFRGEVRESEYQKVATAEFGAFEVAFKALEQYYKQYYTDFQLPHVTIIGVQQQSSYRIVPAQVDSRGKPGNQNVRAGTVVDEHIVNPMYTEFLLVAHHVTQGAACPSRYTVLVDTCSPRIPLEELEYVSYHLCYAHGIACSPVSLPAPLMAAADLKKRGRNNWKVANFGDDPSSEDGLFTGDGSEQFFINMTNALKSTIPTKFWA